MDEQQSPAPEAGGEVVSTPQIVETTAQEAQVEAQTEGQVEDQPAEPEGEEKSRAKERRERRKAYTDRLTRERDDARGRLERITRAAESEAEPKDADYDDPTEYAAAKAVWASERRMVARETAEATAAQQAAETEYHRLLASDFEEQKAEARGRYVDYDRVVGDPSVFIAPHLARLIIESEQSADLAYAIARDPARAAHLSGLNPIMAARELGRIEASLRRPEPKRTSQAPQPIRPVTPAASVQKDPAKETYKEYVAKRRKEMGWDS